MAKMSAAGRERHYFEMFRKAYALSEASIEYGDKPDVVVQKAGKRIGVEITNFYIKPGHLADSEQVQRARRQVVVAEAHRTYIEQNGKKFELTFTFNERCPILNEREVATKIVALAKHAEGRQTGQLPRALFEEIPELLSVWLNAKEYVDAKWQVGQSQQRPTTLAE